VIFNNSILLLFQIGLFVETLGTFGCAMGIYRHPSLNKRATPHAPNTTSKILVFDNQWYVALWTDKTEQAGLSERQWNDHPKD
jgi:hypothetical protein